MSSGIQVKGDFLSMLDGQVLRVSFYDGGLSGVTRGGGVRGRVVRPFLAALSMNGVMADKTTF